MLKKRKILISHFFTTINSQMFGIAAEYLFNFKRWDNLTKWPDIKKLENSLNKFINWPNSKNTKIISFYNWRSALYHWLKIAWVWDWDEVIIQAFTCISVVNAVIQTWAIPVYADIDRSLNSNTWTITNLLSKKTKAIIAQHTFWMPSSIEELQKLCKKKKICLIEDCAHSLWAKANKKYVWSFWDMSIFSLWRDKVISSVNWWFLLLNNLDYHDKLKAIKKKLKPLKTPEIVKNLIYILISFISSKTFWFLWLWKAIMFLSRKLKIVPEVVEKEEKDCCFNEFNYSMPNALASIWLSQFDSISKQNRHRSQIASIYKDTIFRINSCSPTVLIKMQSENNNTEPIYLRYAIFVQNRDSLLYYFRKNNVYLWNWYSSPIDPQWVNMGMTRYKAWSCSNAQHFSSQCLNLPNHSWITIEDAEYISRLLQDYYSINLI